MKAILRLLWRLSMANMRRQRTRWLLTIIGIALGVASFAGVLAISGAIINAFEQSVAKTAGVAQLQVSNGTAGVMADVVDAVRTIPGVELASGNVQYSVTVPALRRRVMIHGVLLGGDQAHHQAQFGRDVLELADPLTFLNQPDSIALTPELMDERHWSVGSHIEVLGSKGSRTLVVRGRVNPDGALRAFGGDIAVMDSDAAQVAFGELDRFHWVDVVVASGFDIDAVRKQIEVAVAGRAIVGTPLGRGQRMQAMLSTLRWMLSASSVVALLVGAFLIQHTVGTAIRQRAADLTTLRALGASRKLIAVYVLGEISIVGLVGTLCGLVAGIGFAALASDVFGNAVGQMYAPIPSPTLALTPAQISAVLLVGEGTVLVAALAPCIGLLRLRPVGGHRELRSRIVTVVPWRILAAAVALYGVGWCAVQYVPILGFAQGIAALAVFSGCIFLGTTLVAPTLLVLATPAVRSILRSVLGMPGAWTWLQVLRQRFHTATTIGALAAGVTFSVGLATLLGSYRDAFSGWLRQTLSADVFVNAGTTVSLLGGPTVDLALARELETIDGVARVMPWRFLEVEFRGRPIIVQGVDERLLARWHPDVHLDDTSDDILVSDTLAERFGLGVGDSIDVRAPRKPLHGVIKAIVPDYALDLGSVMLGWKRFHEHFGIEAANLLLVDADPRVPARSLQRKIELATAERYDATVLTADELRKLTDALIDQSFALTYWLQALAVLVTVLAMMNATSAAILDRSDDIGIWRSLGLERRRLLIVLAAEAGILGLVAALLGVAAGAFVGKVLVEIVAPSVAGFRMPLRWPASTMVAMLLLTTVTAAIVAAFVGRSTTERRIVPVGE